MGYSHDQQWNVSVHVSKLIECHHFKFNEKGLYRIPLPRNLISGCVFFSRLPGGTSPVSDRCRHSAACRAGPAAAPSTPSRSREVSWQRAHTSVQYDRGTPVHLCFLPINAFIEFSTCGRCGGTVSPWARGLLPRCSDCSSRRKWASAGCVSPAPLPRWWVRAQIESGKEQAECNVCRVSTCLFWFFF